MNKLPSSDPNEFFVILAENSSSSEDNPSSITDNTFGPNTQDEFFTELLTRRGVPAAGSMPSRFFANPDRISDIITSFHTPDASNARSKYFYNTRQNMLYVRKVISGQYAVWQPLAYF